MAEPAHAKEMSEGPGRKRGTYDTAALASSGIFISTLNNTF